MRSGASCGRASDSLGVAVDVSYEDQSQDCLLQRLLAANCTTAVKSSAASFYCAAALCVYVCVCV